MTAVNCWSASLCEGVNWASSASTVELELAMVYFNMGRRRGGGGRRDAGLVGCNQTKVIIGDTYQRRRRMYFVDPVSLLFIVVWF